MGEVINMRRARKAKTRAAKERQADENRIRFGRTKADRNEAVIEAQKQAALLDGAFREKRDKQDEGK